MPKSVDKNDVIEAMEDWYAALPRYGGEPAKGALTSALVILERLKTQFELSREAHTAKGGAQIRGLTGSKVKEILQRFDEYRQFSKEGGRTNRGVPRGVDELLRTLDDIGIAGISDKKREPLLSECQRVVVSRITERLNKAGIRFSYVESESTPFVVRRILDAAKAVNKYGPVAEYLVGAKLALRFPNENIRNSSYSTSDEQHGEPGDFVVGNTVFHVTVAPNTGHYEKCAQNIQDGYQFYLLVPSSEVTRIRSQCEVYVSEDRIVVRAIEDFVGQNIDELATFSKDARADNLLELLTSYNERVDEVESDKTCIIQIPTNLTA